jgi:uncharacterized membrane protein
MAWDRWGRTAFERPLPESDAVLWTVVILASVLDVVTTIVGIGRGFPEGHVVARVFMETYGTPGIGLLKFSALVVVTVGWFALPDRQAEAGLRGMAVASLVVVALNTATLAGV